MSLLSVDPALLRLAVQLTVPGVRLEAARTLAAALGAEELILFHRDPEIGAMLAAPGFPQALPDAKAWRAFLGTCVTRGHHRDMLPRRATGERIQASGWAEGGDDVLVLLGGDPLGADPEWLRVLLPMLGSVFNGEFRATSASMQVRLSSEAAARAEALMRALDATRVQLEGALADARQARQELERANESLQAQAVELELANEQLREQAIAVEAQAIELEAQAEELQDANVRLEEARAAADAASRAKSDFLATMSHELRTPLNAIGGHVQIIEMGLYGPVTPEQHDALRRIDRSQRHLLGLINNILNLSRIEAGGLEYLLTDVSVSDALADLAPMIEPQLLAKQIAYEVRNVTRVPAVRADREKLQQVLLNLLSNAVKFTQVGGKVWIDAKEDRESGHVSICVSDDGRGIPRDKLEVIFDPIVQVDARHSRLGQGTGLGLAISRDLARGMGGDLEATSDLGGGSVFTLTLPTAEPVPDAPDNQRAESAL